MRELDMADPDLGEGVEMATTSQRDLWARGIDPDGLDPFQAKILADTLLEVDLMTDDELAELEAEGQAASGPEFDAWMDALPDDTWQGFHDEARLSGDYRRYWDFAHGIDRSLAAMTDREGVRKAEDAADAATRRGPHHNRPGTEVVLSNALGRLERGTYVYGGQPVDLAGDPDIESLLYTGPALSRAEVADEMHYQLTGAGPRPALHRYREPLPPVARLAVNIGLRS